MPTASAEVPAAMMPAVRRGRTLVPLLLVALVATGCSSSTERARGSAGVLRLGVFPTLTHAVAHVGLGSGIFQRTLGDTEIRTTVLNSGTEASIALLSGGLDATFIGPWPAASLYLRSGEVAIVAGAANGGTSFVVRTGAGISRPADLRGRRVAVPNLGNSQDLSLRTWLHEHGMAATDEGGDVAIVSVDTGELSRLFRLGAVDAAWAPEPYPTSMIESGLARRLAGGSSASAALLVSSIYLDAHPDVIRRLVDAEVQTIVFMRREPDAAMSIASRQLAAEGAPAVPAGVIASAWDRVTFTWQVDPRGMVRTGREAYALGLLPHAPSGLLGIYRLDDLNTVLNDDGLPPVPDPLEVR
jgi:NitT/TauT family transport system substrate-binding protein